MLLSFRRRAAGTAARRLSQRALSSSQDVLPTLRRFLMQVHPDLIPSAFERSVNSVNVGLLQSYIRDHTYTGSANLIFYKKPEQQHDDEPSSLREVRVVVGRGVDASVQSMRAALGEAPPLFHQKPRHAERVAEMLFRRRRTRRNDSAAKQPRANETLASFCEGLESDGVRFAELKSKRRAAQHAAARAARLAATFGLAKVESRCGWTPRRLSQLLAGIEAAAAAAVSLEGFTLVISTTDKKPVDEVEGLLHLSPSRQLVDWKRTFASATEEACTRRADHEARRNRKLAQAEASLLRERQDSSFPPNVRVKLERGATLSAADFETLCLDSLLRRRRRQEDGDHPFVQGGGGGEQDDVVVVRVERELPHDAVFSRAGFVVVAPPMSRESVWAAVDAVEKSDLRAVARTRELILEEAARCVERLGLRDVELFFEGQPDSTRVGKRTSTVFSLSGAHRPPGAALPDVLEALVRLGSFSGKALEGASVAVVAKGASLAENDVGQILVPADFR